MRRKSICLKKTLRWQFNFPFKPLNHSSHIVLFKKGCQRCIPKHWKVTMKYLPYHPTKYFLCSSKREYDMDNSLIQWHMWVKPKEAKRNGSFFKNTSIKGE